MEISITKTTTPKQKPADESKLGFGQYYTDHMFIMNYDEGEGWHNPRIVPYGPKYKERYERDIDAGRRFAKATRIDKAAAKVQKSVRKRLFYNKK